MDDNKFLSLIKNSICSNWELPALSDYKAEPFYYKDFARKIAEIHLMFDAMGVKKGDKVALCGRNSASWAISFFATVSYGAVIVTILHDFDGHSIQNIVNHSDSKVLFVNDQVWAKVNPADMPNVETIFTMDDDFAVEKASSAKLIETREDMSRIFKEKYPNGFTPKDVVFHDEKADELALINYTSGTTSSPKGVMIPFRSLWSNTKVAIDLFPYINPGDGMVCILPMAHMYGLAFEILFAISMGCHIHFLSKVPSPQVILEMLSKVNPPIVLSVPLIMEKIIQTKVFPELKKQPAKTLLHIPFIRKRIYAKVTKKLLPLFGNKLIEVAVGGAALNKEVGNFLSEIKFPYTVGYGMTECGPLISYASSKVYKPESCGKPVDRMICKVDSSNPEKEIGELIVKGANVMLGYYKNPELTESVLDKDGWLKTGDLVTMDKDEFVFIKGRSKTMVLGPSGQNIYPEEIEDLLNNSQLISEVLVIEEAGKLIALVYPDKDYIEREGIKRPDLEKLLAEDIKFVNKKLPRFSQISNCRIQDQEFEKTPKRSIKRFLYQKH